MPRDHATEGWVRSSLEKGLSGGSYILMREWFEDPQWAPLLIAALDDPSARVKPPTSDLPAQLILQRLAVPAPPEAVEPAARYLDHASCAQPAANCLTRIGTAQAGEALSGGMSRVDPKLLGYQLAGVRQAMTHGRAQPDPSFIDAVWPAIIQCIQQSSDNLLTSEHIEAMLLLDTHRTVENLRTLGALASDHPLLPILLDCANRMDIVLDRRVLLPLMSDIFEFASGDVREFGRERRSMVRDALPLLARVDPDAAEPWIERAADSGKYPLDEAATDARAVLAQVDRIKLPDAFIDGRWQIDRLTGPQLNYVAAYRVDERVCNSGIDNALVDLGGLAPYAPAALRAIGANTSAQLMQRALDVIGTHRDGADYDDYDALNDAVTAPETAAVLSEIEDAWYTKCDDNVMRLLKAYAITNADHFRVKTVEPRGYEGLGDNA